MARKLCVAAKITVVTNNFASFSLRFWGVNVVEVVSKYPLLQIFLKRRLDMFFMILRR